MNISSIVTEVIPLLLVIVPVVLWFWSGIWAGRDAAVRGKSGWLVGLLVMLVAWPLSLLVWIALRPENPKPPFDLNRYRVQ
jgi:hypothetical protein